MYVIETEYNWHTFCLNGKKITTKDCVAYCHKKVISSLPIKKQ